eukprot:6515674-Prymnesium_polylepis.1
MTMRRTAEIGPCTMVAALAFRSLRVETVLRTVFDLRILRAHAISSRGRWTRRVARLPSLSRGAIETIDSLSLSVINPLPFHPAPRDGPSAGGGGSEGPSRDARA